MTSDKSSSLSGNGDHLKEIEKGETVPGLAADGSAPCIDNGRSKTPAPDLLHSQDQCTPQRLLLTVHQSSSLKRSHESPDQDQAEKRLMDEIATLVQRLKTLPDTGRCLPVRQKDKPESIMCILTGNTWKRNVAADQTGTRSSNDAAGEIPEQHSTGERRKSSL